MKYPLKAQGIHMKSTMKYPCVKNEISIESARYSYEKRNEISLNNEICDLIEPLGIIHIALQAYVWFLS